MALSNGQDTVESTPEVISALSANEGKNWLTMGDAMNAAGVSSSTIHNWITRKQVVSKKVRDNSRAGFHYEVTEESLMKRKATKNTRGRRKTATKQHSQGKRKGQQTHEDQNQKDTGIDPVSYLYGHCETFISIYARGIGVSEAALARGVAQRLLASTGG